jgi:tetratricopeptide (TPR) repeat protein
MSPPGVSAAAAEEPPVESAAGRASRMVRIGLAIAFAVPFSVGAIVWIAALIGADLGSAVLFIRLSAALAEIVALILVIRVGEQRLLGSVGIREPAGIDLKIGLAFGAAGVALAILIPSIFASSMPQGSVALWSRIRALYVAQSLPLSDSPLALALLVAAAAAIAEELAMRGFAASRLRTLTGSVLIGGAAALAIDLIAHLPLWGLAYTIEIAPIEALLVGLFLWKRRLLPCIVANFTAGAAVLILVALAGSQAPAAFRASAGAPALKQPAPASKRERAIEKLRHTLESNASPADPFVNRAVEDARKGDYDKAEAEIGKAIAAVPNAPGLYVYRGDLYSLQYRHDLAIADYSKALELSPADAAIYRKRALEFVAKGDDEAAHRDYAKAIDLKPKDPGAYFERSGLYFEEKRYDEALRDIGEAIKLEPANTKFLMRRVQTLRRIGQYDRAIADCNRIIALNSKLPEGYYYRSQEEFAKGDLRAAIADLGEVLKRQPGSVGALETRADLEMRLHEWSAARADLVALADSKSVDDRTADWAAWALASSVHPELRDGKAAVALATHACEMSGWKIVERIDALAAAYAESGDFAQAVKWQNQAIRLATVSEPASVEFLRWQLKLYESGRPYREDESGPVGYRSQSRTILQYAAVLLALIGLGTVIAVITRLIRPRRNAGARA